MNEPASSEPEKQPVESVADPKPSSPPDDNPMVSGSRSIRPHGLADGLKLATAAARVALDNKASNVAVLDVSAQSAEFDFFVVIAGLATGLLY